MSNTTTSDDVSLRNGHTGAEWQQLNSQERVYLMSDFCKFSLPYTDPGNIEAWRRTNGHTLYTVHPAEHIGADGYIHPNWLYGKIGRLLLIWLSTQVVLRKTDESRTVTLPRSLNRLMRDLGVERASGKPNSRDYARFRTALTAAAGLHITVTTYDGDDAAGSVRGQNLIVADEYEITWSAQTIGQDSTITLNKNTYERMQNSTPLDAAAVLLLTSTSPFTRGRSRGQDLDLYCWLNARNYALTHSPTRQTSPITWQQLAQQFGNTYTNLHDFVKRFKISLENVRMVWPDLNVEVINGTGIVLHQSKRSVKPKMKLAI